MSIDKNSIISKYFCSEIKDYFLFTHGITLSQTIHSCIKGVKRNVDKTIKP